MDIETYDEFVKMVAEETLKDERSKEEIANQFQDDLFREIDKLE